MPSIPNIVVVGSINVDLVVTVDQFPAPGETLLGTSFRQVGGGKGANQAVAAARLGAPVTMVARVGDDAFGRSAIAALEAEGIDCRFVTVTPGTPTGIAAITIQESNGENNIVVVPGANHLLTAADIDAAKEAFVTADCLILSLEVPLDAIRAAVEIAAENRVNVTLNPAPAQTLADDLLRNVRILIPNETEAETLTGLEDTEAASKLLSEKIADPGVVVVTLGGSGVLSAKRGQAPLKTPAFPVEVVDTVGAGDCFTAAFTVGLHEMGDLDEALRFALAAGALAVTRVGAQDAMPRRTEVEALMRSGA